LVPPASTVANPLDIGALDDTPSFKKAIELTASACEATVAIVSSLAHSYDSLASLTPPPNAKVVLSHLSPEERFTPSQMEELASRAVAVVPLARGAVRGLEIWAARFANTPRRGTAEVASRPSTQLGLTGTLDRIGWPLTELLPTSVIVRSADEAEVAWAALGPSVAVKADGRVLAHRSEFGAVRTEILSAADVREAFNIVAQACDTADGRDDVLVQAMAAAGQEVMLSVVNDPEVGAVVLLRSGGVLVEGNASDTLVLTGDESQWTTLLECSDVGWLLAGPRGRTRSDAKALLGVCAALRNAVQNDPEITILECNPVIVHEYGAGVAIVDAIAYLVETPEIESGASE
jgi:hypothetical protein